MLPNFSKKLLCRHWANPLKRCLATNIPTEHDVVIVGGGLMGCSTAYHLISHDPSLRVCIVERDPSLSVDTILQSNNSKIPMSSSVTAMEKHSVIIKSLLSHESEYSKASSALSMSGIRQQFSIEENIRLSSYSMEFLRDIGTLLHIPGEDPPDVQFVEQGYLILSSEQGAAVAEENHKIQRKCGVRVDLLSANQLRDKFPWLNVDGIALGSFGYKNEGWFDPWTLLTYLKKVAVHLGVHYLHGDVTGLGCHKNRVTNVEVLSKSDPVTLSCKWLVNAAGAWAEQVSQMAGIGDPTHADYRMHRGLPVKPRKRMIFSFHCSSDAQGLRHCPLVTNITGDYFRPEGRGNLFLTGKSPVKDKDPDGFDFEVDFTFFEEEIWPAIAHRVPAFESIKVQNGWAGLYEYNTLDQNAILGPHPVISNLLFANGFSGHGLQQSVAVGRVISDIIFHGDSHVVDISKLSFQRVIDQKPFKEKNIY